MVRAEFSCRHCGGMYVYSSVLAALVVVVPLAREPKVGCRCLMRSSNGWAARSTTACTREVRFERVTPPARFTRMIIRCVGGRAGAVRYSESTQWESFCADVLQRPEVTTDSRFATNDDRHQHRADCWLLSKMYPLVNGERGCRSARRWELRTDE